MDLAHVTPPTVSAVDARRTSRAIGEAPLFPNPGNPSEPSRHAFNAWWPRREELAKLPLVYSRRWHGLRRNLATETKMMPLKDEAYAGGWKSTKTLLDVYQRADWETIRGVLANRSQLKKVAG